MLRSLVEAFQDEVELPIEIEEVRDEIVRQGFQDRIILFAGDLNTDRLRGTFTQWTERGSVYGDPELVTLIIYPKAESARWQRLVCAKELVHVCDMQIAKTKTPEAIEELAERLLGRFEDNKDDEADLMASVDKLAQFQGINLLFPKAARSVARTKLASGEKTIDEIVDWVALPRQFVELALSDIWEKFSELLITFGNGEAG